MERGDSPLMAMVTPPDPCRHHFDPAIRMHLFVKGVRVTVLFILNRQIPPSGGSFSYYSILGTIHT